jgi:hypothetical protein
MSRAQFFDCSAIEIAINYSFGSRRALFEAKWFATLVELHNDPNDDMFETVINSSDLQAERDIVHLNRTSLWFLCSVIQAIECGWIFQLNGNATLNFCCRVVDMISLGVNSLGAHNHTL